MVNFRPQPGESRGLSTNKEKRCMVPAPHFSIAAEQEAAAGHAVKRCTARVLLVIATLFFAGTMAWWNPSSGAPVATRSDALIGQQCGLSDNRVRNKCDAVQEASDTSCSVRRYLAVAFSF